MAKRFQQICVSVICMCSPTHISPVMYFPANRGGQWVLCSPHPSGSPPKQKNKTKTNSRKCACRNKKRKDASSWNVCENFWISRGLRFNRQVERGRGAGETLNYRSGVVAKGFLRVVFLDGALCFLLRDCVIRCFAEFCAVWGWTS